MRHDLIKDWSGPSAPLFLEKIYIKCYSIFWNSRKSRQKLGVKPKTFIFLELTNGYKIKKAIKVLVLFNYYLLKGD